MMGGYRLGFEAMAGLTLVAAALCCFLYPAPALVASALVAPLKSATPVLTDNP